MRHSTGNNSQATIEHRLVVHDHEFYFASLFTVNIDLLLKDIGVFSHHGIIQDIRPKLGSIKHDNRSRRQHY